MFPVRYVYMVLVDPGLMMSLMRSSRNNLSHIFGPSIEARYSGIVDSSNGQPIGRCPWAIVWA